MRLNSGSKAPCTHPHLLSSERSAPGTATDAVWVTHDLRCRKLIFLAASLQFAASRLKHVLYPFALAAVGERNDESGWRSKDIHGSAIDLSRPSSMIESFPEIASDWSSFADFEDCAVVMVPFLLIRCVLTVCTCVRQTRHVSAGARHPLVHRASVLRETPAHTDCIAPRYLAAPCRYSRTEGSAVQSWLTSNTPPESSSVRAVAAVAWLVRL
jgi:hypothetical protein